MKIALLVLLLLVGCGGGDPEPVMDTVQACNPLKIQLYGDSTMVNLDAFTLKDGKTALQRLLPTDTFENKGVPGTTTQNLLDGGFKPDADLIVVNFGLNDAARVQIDTYRANLLTIGRTARTVFLTPNRVTASNDPTAYVAVMIEVAASLNAPLVDIYGMTPDLIDGVHPSPDMEEHIAIQLSSALACTTRQSSR